MPVLDRRPRDIAPGTLEERLVDAAVRCVARWGPDKMTLTDVADEARVSRATAYRAFPGGKDALLLVVTDREVSRFFDGLAGRLEAAGDLEELVTIGLTEAGRALAERSTLLPLLAHMAMTGEDSRTSEELHSVLRLVCECATPHLARFIDASRAAGVAELLARLAVTYALLPSSEVDICSYDSVKRFAGTMLLPALRNLQR